MATMTCKAFLNHLEPWMDGSHPPDAEAHLRNCPDCRNVIADLNAIRSEARSWNTEEVEPPARIWTSLRSQLEQEGLIRDDRSPQPQPSNSGWFSGWFAGLPRPALAGAYLVLLIAVAFGLSRPIDKRVNEARWLEGTQVSTSPRSEEHTSELQSP